MKTYTFDVVCGNCQTTQTLVIDKGTTTTAAIAVAVCTNCACNIRQ
jgi:hypothetical protein